MLRFALMLLLSVFVSGCAQSIADQVKELHARSAEAAAVPIADVVQFRCDTLSPEARDVLKDAVNAELTSRGSVHRVTNIACQADLEALAAQ